MADNLNDFDSEYEKVLGLFHRLRDLSVDEVEDRLLKLMNSQILTTAEKFSIVLKAAHYTNLNEVRGLSEYINTLDLYIESKKHLQKAFEELCGGIRTPQVLNDHRNKFGKLCMAIQLAHGHSTLKSLTLDEFSNIWDQIRSIQKIDSKVKAYSIPFKLLAKVADLEIGSNLSASVRLITKQTTILSDSYGLVSTQYMLSVKYTNWSQLYEKWLDDLGKKTSSHEEYSMRYFLAHLDTNKFEDTPLAYLSGPRESEFHTELKSFKITSKDAILSTMNKFSYWVIEKYLDGYGRPLATQSQLDQIRPNPSGKRRKSTETTKEIMPELWVHLCKQILTENDFAWPKSIPWQYFDWLNPETGEVERTFSPVTTNLFLLLFEIPIRKIQAQMLDSGEGDSEKFDINTKRWGTNTSPHANYWKNVGAVRNERGVITKIRSEGKTLAGLYINTNKTQDVQNNFDEQSGYTMPWQNEEAMAIIQNMRSWQEKYNPIEKPIEYRDIPRSSLSSKPSKLALEMVPARFYLFRNPIGDVPAAPGTEGIIFRFWHWLMSELERRLIISGEDVKIVLTRYTTGAPKTSLFTPHGLRAYGLTSLSKNGVPIEYLSKLIAGHSSILMTMHYVKHSPGEISEVLNNARRKAEANAQDEFLTRLNNSNYEQAKSFAIANSLEALELHQLRYSAGAKTNYNGSSIGLCTTNGTGCNDGGNLIKKNGERKSSLYGPVEGGPNNCSKCRHFITGSPWKIPLWLEGNKKFADSQKLSLELERLYVSKSELDSQHRDEMYKDPPSTEIIQNLNNQIKSVYNTIELKTKVLDELLSTVHAIHNLINKIDAISKNSKSDSSYSIIVSSDIENIIDYEVSSRLEILNLLVHAGDLYEHVADEDFRRERDEFVNEILFNCNLRPISFSPLTDEEKKKALNDASNFLLQTLTRNELIQIENKHITLNDLGLVSSVQSAMKSLSAINPAIFLPSKGDK